MISSNSIKNTDYEILTPGGFKDFEGINILPESYLFLITLEDGSEIKCTYNHIFVVEGIEIRAIELLVNEVLDTSSGLKKIKDITPINKETVYDIAGVDSEDKLYYTNNIVSHNCKFLGSTALLIDGDSIENIKVKNPIRTSFNDKLFIYQNPVPGAFYILGVDSAEGAKLDFSVIHVLRFHSATDIRQVAVYRSNEIHPNVFAQIVVEISRMYNEAYLMIENNAVGAVVCNVIWNTIEYDKIVNTEKRGLGFKTTHKSKVAGNMLLKRYMEAGWLTLYDKSTKRELSVFENAGENIWKASSGNHDDTVMALSIAISFINTIYYDPSDIESGNIQKNLNDSNEMPKINDGWDADYSSVTNLDDEDDIGKLFALFQEGT